MSVDWFIVGSFLCRDQFLEQRHELLSSLGPDAVADARPVDLSLNPSRISEHLEVLRDGRLGEGQTIDDVPADALAGSQEEPDNRDPCRMPQRFGQAGQVPVLGAPFRASLRPQPQRNHS
jgi:hypothetical protein